MTSAVTKEWLVHTPYSNPGATGLGCTAKLNLIFVDVFNVLWQKTTAKDTPCYQSAAMQHLLAFKPLELLAIDFF